MECGRSWRLFGGLLWAWCGLVWAGWPAVVRLERLQAEAAVRCFVQSVPACIGRAVACASGRPMALGVRGYFSYRPTTTRSQPASTPAGPFSLIDPT